MWTVRSLKVVKEAVVHDLGNGSVPMMLSDSWRLGSVKLLVKRNSCCGISPEEAGCEGVWEMRHGCLYLVALLKSDRASAEETRVRGRKSECCRSACVREKRVKCGWRLRKAKVDTNVFVQEDCKK